MIHVRDREARWLNRFLSSLGMTTFTIRSYVATSKFYW